MSKNNFQICEFGTIRKANDYGLEAGNDSSENKVYLPDKAFESLVKFVLDNQNANDVDPPFQLFRKQTHQQILVKNYVGVIETKDHFNLEILPKIHIPDSTDYKETKHLFLRMLKHLKNSPFRQIDEAHLYTQKDFPILEVFISAFIQECEELILKGIRSNYISEEDNISYLRGKLDISKNIRYNSINKTKFYCNYSEFHLNIPQNRIMKSALHKLYDTTRNYSNLSPLSKLLNHLESIDESANIESDLRTCRINNRLFIHYRNILLWSEIFLLGKSFTNFKGNSVNKAILFPMERIFEDYIAFLCVKHAEGYKIKTQDKTYFLVEKHQGSGKFRLIPDIFMENDKGGAIERTIIDTKWKLLNQDLASKNYNIKSSDMYQLYAYGKKYNNGKDPRLAMIYPTNPDFTQKLDPFYYEGDLKLDIHPFDLAKDHNEEMKRIVSEL